MSKAKLAITTTKILESRPEILFMKKVRLQEVDALRIFRQSALERGNVVSPKHRPPSSQGNIPDNLFSMLSRPQGHSAAGRIKSMKNLKNVNGNRTRGPPVCSAVP
jgi:hypothetical protein